MTDHDELALAGIDSDPVFLALTEHITERLQSGNSVDAGDNLSRYPQWAGAIPKEAWPMKRTVVLLRPRARAGSVLLVLSILFLAGCSGGDAGINAAAKYGLERSEFIAIKKAAKSPRDFKKALVKKKNEQLEEQRRLGDGDIGTKDE